MTTYAGHTAEALRALAEGATPGPWHEIAESGEWWIEGGVMPDDAGFGVAVCDSALVSKDGKGGVWAEQADIDFVCAANPATVLALLDEVARLRGALEGLKAATEEEMSASAAFYYHETIDNGTRANKAVGALIDALSAARAALEAPDATT